MDVGELLDYKPNLAKRELEGKEDTDKPKKKAARLQLGSGSAVTSGMKRTSNVVAQVEKAEEEDEEERQMKLLEMVEQQNEGTVGDAMEVLDDQGVKKMVLSFEKRVLRNQEMRIKFPDNPEKFMESELDLNDVISEMKVLATMPEHYHYLVELRAVNSFLTLLNHANADISIAVVDLLQELTDIDTLTENEEGAEVLIDALMDGQATSVFVQNMERLDETVKEEAEGVHNTLGVIENMLELKPEICPIVAQQGLLQWLLKRLKAKKEFDANKLYCAEILSILLHTYDKVRKLLGELDGIDILLQLLAVYKRNDPTSSEETEMMENLFNCLCSSLLHSPNRGIFLKGEGIQLMNLMLREKKMSRNSALKVLDHAMNGVEGADNCAKFVEILGLRSLFPIFMRPPKRQKKSGVRTKVHEEHAVSIIASMFKNLQGSQRQRLVAKFTESDHAKVDRLMEIHFKYLGRMQATEVKLEQEKASLKQRGEWDEEMEDEQYLQRLDAGLFLLEQVDYIIVEVASSGNSSIKERIKQILNLRGGSVQSIRAILREYAGHIGDQLDDTASKAERERIIALADKF